jgi:hypothetical protein
MKLSLPYLLAIMAAAATYFVISYLVDRSLAGKSRVLFRYVAVGGAVAAFFYLMQEYVDDRDRAQRISKAIIAIMAAGAIFYEQHREGLRRPVAERWKKLVGVMLALAAVTAYNEGFKYGYHRFYHRHDQFHYYLGAKYFPEMGYDGLYKCAAIAQDEIGVVQFDDEDHIGTGHSRLDMSKEVRHPDRRIRNLGGDNLLMPVTEVLEHPEQCKSHFSEERWAAFKDDVRFFRLAADKGYWEGFNKDHGYNPPPVWTVMGNFFANLHPATTRYLQFLASLDVMLLAGLFAGIWWAFGWRVCCVGLIFWGCQAMATSMWTQGAFLRQDWLFFFVMAACLTRKRYYGLAGASMVYSALLRIFPGLAVIGWLTVAGWRLVRYRRLSRPMWRMLAGGTLAAAVLLPLSVKVAGRDSYQAFYQHLEVHNETPLTNHMGLRVLVGQRLPFEIPAVGIGVGAGWGRQKYVEDNKAVDPFGVWMKMRNERYHKYRFVAYGIIALTIALFALVTRRIRSLWIAQCLGQIFIMLMSQLTNYYYSFMILLAPLTKVRRQLEAPLFGLAALSQFISIVFGYYDDQFWMLTLLSVGFCYGLLCYFAGPDLRGRVLRWFGRGGQAGAEPAA